MKSILSFVLCLLAAGCQYDPYAHTYTTHQPTPTEVAGEYELETIRMDFFAPEIESKVNALSSPPRIILSEDGNFEAFDFPFLSEDKYHFEAFRHVAGQWEMREAGNIGYGNENLQTFFGLEMSGLPFHLAHPALRGKTKVDGLIFRFDDPDLGQAIIFRKK